MAAYPFIEDVSILSAGRYETVWEYRDGFFCFVFLVTEGTGAE